MVRDRPFRVGSYVNPWVDRTSEVLLCLATEAKVDVDELLNTEDVS